MGLEDPYSLVSPNEVKCFLIWSSAREAEEERENEICLDNKESFPQMDFLRQICIISKKF